jgi:mycofactocin system glycosyltransferase
MTCRLHPEIRLVENSQGSFLVRETPLAILRVNGALAAIVKRLLADPDGQRTAGEEQTLELLAARGFAERLTDPAMGDVDLPLVSIVIPVKDRAEELVRCLTSLEQLDYPRERREIIVVDDGSSDGSPSVAVRFGCKLVATDEPGSGPGAARNLGVSVAKGEILAFIDSDCTASTGWLRELAGGFTDPSLAAVGGLVDGMRDAGALDRYEAVMSSLTLGTRAMTGSTGDDTFYLPSCNLLVRAEAFRSVEGFSPEMHVGEDVDLSWRLRDAGWRISYLPSGRIWHEHRSRFIAFLKRRFDYGTSEGTLNLLHPERRKRMIIPPAPALSLLLVIAALFGGGPWCLAGALVLTVGDTLFQYRRLSRQGLRIGGIALLRARIRGTGSLAYYLSYHLLRYYAWLFICLSVILPEAGLLLILLAFLSGSVDYWVKRPGMNICAFLAFYLPEQLAYGAGVFAGCLNRKHFGSYRFVVRRNLMPG